MLPLTGQLVSYGIPVLTYGDQPPDRGRQSAGSWRFLGWKVPLVACHTYEPEYAGAGGFQFPPRAEPSASATSCGLRWEFVFQVCRWHGGGQAQELQCSLPSRGTNGIPGCWFPIRRGIKAARFSRAVRTLGRYREWEVRVWLIRATHQVFLHAFESGLRVIGLTRAYAIFRCLGLADFKQGITGPSRRFEEDPSSIFDSVPWFASASLRLTDGQGGEDIIRYRPPRKWGSGAPSACWRSFRRAVSVMRDSR